MLTVCTIHKKFLLSQNSLAQNMKVFRLGQEIWHCDNFLKIISDVCIHGVLPVVSFAAGNRQIKPLLPPANRQKPANHWQK